MTETKKLHWTRKRLLDRISWEGNGETGTEDHAWYVWGPRSRAPNIAPALLWEGKSA